MGAASHLGIRLRDYDARIRTFIPHYDAILDAAAGALVTIGRRAPVILDLGIGTGALAARAMAVAPAARLAGIDNDDAMLAVARRRLRGRLTTLSGDFLSLPLPMCDAITASFSLHHVPTRRRKAALYARCFAAIRPGGMLVNADCCLSSSPRLQARDRAAWLDHLRKRYSPARGERFLRTWAREDVYFRLEDEIAMLRKAGFTVDVPWRRDSFAVVLATRRT
jgi:tRNA (cmo5U34)-methyltransferase